MPPDTDWFAPLVPVARDLLAACEDYGARLVLIGGVAASALGEPRYTQDLDATSDVDPDDAEEFFRVLERHQLVPRRADALILAQKGRIVVLHHLPSATPADVSLALLPFEFEVIERARPVPLGDIVVRIATPEDMCIMKAVAAADRAKYDLEDIRQIIISHPQMDVRRVRRYLREFRDLLDKPEIVDAFEGLWSEVHRGRGKV